ncbi:UNVERIFIED_CONTAM: hypothetical protein FKN15_067803 [Acipenser sinensis]
MQEGERVGRGEREWARSTFGCQSGVEASRLTEKAAAPLAAKKATPENLRERERAISHSLDHSNWTGVSSLDFVQSHNWSARSMNQGDTRAEAAAGKWKADSKNTVEQKGEKTLLFVYKARLTEVGGLHSQRGLLYSGMKQQSPVEEYIAGWLSNNLSAAIHSTTLNRTMQSDKKQGMRSSSQQQAHSSCQTVAGGITRQRGCGKA